VQAYITHRLRGHGIAKGVATAGLVAEFMGQALGSCKGSSMQIADRSMHMAGVTKRMVGANDIDTLAVAVGQIAAVRTGYGPVIIAGHGQMSIASLART
jgi:TPP-dependent pyruvate/acetoin dehydrogenase alpha subunit